METVKNRSPEAKNDRNRAEKNGVYPFNSGKNLLKNGTSPPSPEVMWAIRVKIGLKTEQVRSLGLRGTPVTRLPRGPENGSYRYRTNPDPNTDPWVITGAMKVNRILKPSEVDAMVEATGREPQQRQAGAITDEQMEALNTEIKRTTQQDVASKRDQLMTGCLQPNDKIVDLHQESCLEKELSLF